MFSVTIMKDPGLVNFFVILCILPLVTWSEKREKNVNLVRRFRFSCIRLIVFYAVPWINAWFKQQ